MKRALLRELQDRMVHILQNFCWKKAMMCMVQSGVRRWIIVKE